jgi:hypothetical protein
VLEPGRLGGVLVLAGLGVVDTPYVGSVGFFTK